MRSKNSKQNILDTALRLFSQKGYEGVSPNEIVEAVGITKPTLYYFFGSKEGLFDELLRIHYAQLEATLAPACQYVPHPTSYEQDVFPTLTGIAQVYFTFARENPEFYLMLQALGFAPPSSKAAAVAEKYHVRQYELLEGCFNAIAAHHTNLAGKQRWLAWYFLAMVNAQIAVWQRGYATVEPDDAKILVNQFMHGIFS